MSAARGACLILKRTPTLDIKNGIHDHYIWAEGGAAHVCKLVASLHAVVRIDAQIGARTHARVRAHTYRHTYTHPHTHTRAYTCKFHIYRHGCTSECAQPHIISGKMADSDGVPLLLTT